MSARSGDRMALLAAAAVEIAEAASEESVVGIQERVRTELGSESDPEAEVVVKAVAAQAAAALDRIRSARMYRTLVEQIPAIVYYRPLDAPGQASFVSPQISAILGYEPRQVDPSFWRERIHPDDRERVLAHQQNFRPEQTDRPILEEYRFARADGSWAWIKNYALSVRDESGRARFLMGVIFDDTDSKLAAEKLREAQQLEATGRLAGRIAHDFNNALSVIINYGALAIESLPDGNPIRDDVREIVKAGERARDLTRQLLAFGRQQIRQPRLLDLASVMSSLANMIQGVLGEHIRLVTRIPTGSPSIIADRGQVDLMMMSFAGHARDAMPKGGTLTVEIAAIDFEASALPSDEGMAPGPYVLLSVAESGGESTDTSGSALFQPLSSAHVRAVPVLGLSAVQGIVEQSAGILLVKHAPAGGTRFEIYFPRVEPSLETEPPAAKTSAPKETILLTDDDRHVRRVVSSMLRRRGYHVMEASDPAHAIQLSEEFEGKIDLLLTDVTMPKMNGRELSENLVLRRPDLKTVFMSGYTDDVLLRDRVLTESAVVLQKPFQTEELLTVVQRALAGGS